MSGEKTTRRRRERLFRGATLGAGLLVLVILALIVATTARQAWPALSEQGFDLLGTAWSPSEGTFGILPLAYGTVVVSGIALALAVPVSLLIAAFVAEVAPWKARRPVIYLLDLLAAVPSVVFGLWGILVLAPALQGPFQAIENTLGRLPVIGALVSGPGGVSGRSLLTAGLIVALMITPIVTQVSREVFATVPEVAKDAARALAATRWEVFRDTVLPPSLGGVTGAVVLGLGRALGETIAVALVVGSNPVISANLLGSGDTMAAVIANEFGESGGTHRAALIGVGLVLLLITLIANVAARLIVARATQPSAGRVPA
jgi:phosphate transport system permease protein